MNVISEKYASLGGSGGWMGRPVSGELPSADGMGLCRHYQHGSIFWSRATGAHEVHGLIRDKYILLGGECGILGYPTADAADCGVDVTGAAAGCCSSFQHGAILCQAGAAEAFATHGPIRAHWETFGLDAGWMGFPTSDVVWAADQAGRHQHFEAASIYWKPSIGAREVHGGIRVHWAARGWESNPALGYPVSDERPHGDDRYCDFENGVVFWRRAARKTCELAPATGPPASRRCAEMQNLLAKMIGEKLQAGCAASFLDDGPRIVSISDYGFDGADVRNRQYVMFARIDYDLPGQSHPEITLNIQLGLDAERSAITATICQWNTRIQLPWLASFGPGYAAMMTQLRAQLDPLVGVPVIVEAIAGDARGRIVSAKVMPNGDFNIYLAPQG